MAIFFIYIYIAVLYFISFVLLYLIFIYTYIYITRANYISVRFNFGHEKRVSRVASTSKETRRREASLVRELESIRTFEATRRQEEKWMRGNVKQQQVHYVRLAWFIGDNVVAR